ncbi:hypothetical protein EV368DRAFT_74278 [Lentinula lateritia]|uniref:Uncharacterized protein n=1 Tax=Lentinula aff. lateritia TaxID=2804960 RepID=A0ACC1UBR5_9AGAR|nr:hypothetical protein F5876DRAFT_86677 [Lentinula aff. lateritia]KAJ3852045.1 hypothetical protein EV368DRAFT_74278 [Lentinula lateritia]
MSFRRQNRVSTLAIVLPHPPLLRRRSSLLSQGSVNSPHTPRTSNCASPTCQSWLFANNNNRKSTDSWNSSNQDVGEDCESEWKPDQILLLSRTLDALPSHLVTPFNGPIPPSNLLDKIARGVANAKGPAEWPHSLRATRVKLIEIARQRAKEDPPRGPKSVVTDENDDISWLSRKRSRVIPRRPLYRQSSMDFVNPSDRKNGDNITRLSTRLQRTDSLVPNPTYHPYTRSPRIDQMNRRSSSPPRPAHVPSLISPSTPSSSTLNSFSSLSTSAARRHVIRRSASTFSSSDSSMISGNRSSLADIQRVRRSESFHNPPTPPSTRQAFKRAPSYGALVQEAREREKEKRSNGAVPHIYGSKSREEMNVSPCPSSDEEEKLRNNQAKKVKGPGGKASRSPAAPLPPDSPSSDQGKAKKRTKAKDAVYSESKATSSRLKSPPPASISAVVPTQPLGHPGPQMNLQHSSIFGEELPHLHIPAAPSRPIPSTSSSSSNQRPPATPGQPAGPPRKTLRRVKRLAPSRKISFGSLVAPNGNDTDFEEDDKGAQHPKLGSAFQLS